MKQSLILIATVLLFVRFNQFTKKKIIFFGDSITKAGVESKGYITILGELINKKSLRNQYELIGAGVSGNRITDLFLRLDSDVVAKKPALVFIWIGVNDVWHKEWGTGVDEYTFEEFYKLIIKKLQAKNIKVILCTPAVFGEKKDSLNVHDKEMDLYANIVRKLAANNNCILVDLRKRFIEYDSLNNPENNSRGILTFDGVHLNDAGNQFVAEEMMKVLVK